MALLLMALGFTIGQAVLYPGPYRAMYAESPTGKSPPPESPFMEYAGGFLGVAVALGLWFILTMTAYFGGSGILMASSRARRIEKEDHPQLFNVVEEMTIAAGMGKMPAVYIIDDMAPNAFATGRDPDHAAVAVTAGLLSKLNRDQLQGVVAHEIGHIINRDILFMQMIGVMAGAIVIVADVFLRGMFYSGAGRRYGGSRRRRGGGQGQAIMIIVAIVLAILAPLLARLIYFAASRRREYLADAQSAVLTRYPDGLASALEAIASDKTRPAAVNRVTAPMYIVNPLQRDRKALIGLFSTHPPTHERVRILRGMAGTASFAEYQRASESVGARAQVPASALAAAPAGAIREARAEALEAADPAVQLRQATDAVRSANQFTFLSCPCGIRVKLPPGFKQEHIECPRCHRQLEVPRATTAAGGPTVPIRTAKGRAKPAENLRVTRQKGQWMSFKCPCGNTINLSPGFQADTVQCSKCGRRITIHNK